MEKHSRLFNVKPKELYTSDVESLTSYLSRLAFSHCVELGRLLEEISKELKIEYLPNLIRKRGSDYSKYINNTSDISLDFVQAIEYLTSRNDIINLTFLNWKGLARKGISKDRRVWCKACLQEFKNKSAIVYEKLIWQVNVLEYCHIHQVKLLSICPNCNKENKLISSKLIRSNISKSVDITKIDMWKLNNIKHIMEQMQIKPSIPTNLVSSRIIKNLVSKYTDGNVSSFSRQFNIEKSMIFDWITGKHSIQFDKLLNFSFYFNIPLIKLIETNEYQLININSSAKDILQSSNQPTKLNFDPKKLRNELKNILQSNEIPPASMKEVIKKSNYTGYRLYAHGNDLCKAIAQKRKAYIRRKKKEKEQKIFQEVYRIVEEIVKEGSFPSETIIKNKLTFPIYYKELYLAIRKVFLALNIPNNKY